MPTGLLHEVACDAHDPGAEALTFAWADGVVQRLTFGDVARASRAWQDALAAAGVQPGQAVAVVMGQGPLAAVVHVALSRLGALSVPLSPLFGPDGLAPRLASGRAALAIVEPAKEAAVREAAPSLPVVVPDPRALDPPALPAAHPAPALPATDEPALTMIFTSGTTALPKAAVLPHHVIPGRLAGFLRAHPGFPQPGDRFWSPADWAWIGGLHDSLLAPWALGAPVFAHERTGPFDATQAARLLVEHKVQNAFLAPTALRLWMRSGAPAPALRTLHTAGEPLPDAVHAWAAKAFAAPPREVYGLTECAFLVVNDAARPGVTGKVVPGHTVGIVREDGAPCRAGEVGELTVKQGSPTMMLGYLVDGALKLPLDAKGWLRTGDLARRNPDGNLTVQGRLDDVVKVSGYRVAPREVEAELLRHPAVDECAVVGEFDLERGAALHAYVKAAPGATAGDALAKELQAYVRTRLAAHQVPRRVSFVPELPRTASGKVRRKELRSG